MKKSYRAATTHALAWLRDAAATGLWRGRRRRAWTRLEIPLTRYWEPRLRLLFGPRPEVRATSMVAAWW